MCGGAAGQGHRPGRCGRDSGKLVAASHRQRPGAALVEGRVGLDATARERLGAGAGQADCAGAGNGEVGRC